MPVGRLFSDKDVMTSTITNHRDVVVVGGGQAGLAIGYHLAKLGTNFTILEAAAESAAAWRNRWDSLKLFTSARYDSLPGMAFPGEPDRYPARDEVVDYLTDYARAFDLPVELNSRVRAVRRHNDRYVVELDDRAYEARAGRDRHRARSRCRSSRRSRTGSTKSVVQMHSTAYRSPGSVPDGRILVVGGGNTGFQIAEELAATREVHLAIGSRQTPLPQRILGRDLFWYLDATGLIRNIDDFQSRQADAEARGHADRVESSSRSSAGHRAPRPSRRCHGIHRQLG